MAARTWSRCGQPSKKTSSTLLSVDAPIFLARAQRSEQRAVVVLAVLVARSDELRKGRMHPLELRELPLDRGQALPRFLPHDFARSTSTTTECQELGDLAQREAHVLRVANDAEPSVGGAIETAVATGGPRSLREKPLSLVVPDRVDRYAGALRQISDSQARSAHLEDVKPWT